MPLPSLRILKLDLHLPEMPAPIAELPLSDGGYWNHIAPDDCKKRMLDTSMLFAQVLKPNLRQVWHFLYEYCAP